MFIESSALEQVVAIHPSMTTELAGIVSSQAKSVEVYPLEVIYGGHQLFVPSLSAYQAAIYGLESETLTRIWSELDYRLNVSRVAKGLHIEHL
ncbi:hypothetical protein TNCV_4607721 [Trichonephila clavipes]|nr:hypothetical protein TNCV_4607721 [Trichonephila clavipes]